MTAVTSARNCSQVKRRNVVQHHVMGNFTNYWKIICVTVPTCYFLRSRQPSKTSTFHIIKENE